MEGKSVHLPPGDPQLIANIVNHLKSQGIFDQLRRDLLADVDTKPSYQNLRQRVEGYASKFLSQQTWQPDLNKNQLRDTLRRQINESGMLSSGVDHVIEQLMNPKIFHVQVETFVREYLGLKKPPTPPNIFSATENVTKDSPVETVVVKDEPEAVQRKTNLDAYETMSPKADCEISANLDGMVKMETKEADDSAMVSDSGAEQSDSSILNYSGPMGKTPPPPGVSEDELEGFQYFEVESQSTEKENTREETLVVERERTSSSSDSKEKSVTSEQELDIVPQKMEIEFTEKMFESMKVPVEKDKKLKTYSQHEKMKASDCERSKSADPSKSKHSESKPIKGDSKKRLGSSPQKIQEKPNNPEVSSKSKHLTSTGMKKTESSSQKVSQDSGKRLELKSNKSPLESPPKTEKQKSSSHTSKSAKDYTSSKSSKSKHISSSKSGKAEADGKATSSKSNSSKALKCNLSSENKSKYSEKHVHKSKHTGESCSSSARDDKPKVAKREKSDPKFYGFSSQKTGISEETKRISKDFKKEGKYSKTSEKMQLKDPEAKSCKDGHGCHITEIGKTKSNLVDKLVSESPGSEQVPSCPTIGDRPDHETIDCATPNEQCKLIVSNTEPNLADPVISEVEADSMDSGTGCEGRGDILREILMEKKPNESKSDITISSVHTSDLSSFDDRISLSSVDEIEIPAEVDTKDKKKIPLKEVKEIAAVILKEKTNSSGRSTPNMSSVEPENNKQEPVNENKIQADEAHAEEEQDSSKMSLRRQRRVNPKYASEEYSSIFNEGVTNAWDSDNNVGEAPSRMATRSSQDGNPLQEKQEPQKRRPSRDVEHRPAKMAKKMQPTTESAVELSREKKKKTRSNSESQEVPAEVSRRKRQSTSSLNVASKPEPHHRSLMSSQRYDSSDLYKPRPIITSRRSRSSHESQNTQELSATGRTTRQSSPALKRR